MKKNLRLYILIACIGGVNIIHAQTGSWKLAGNNLTGTEKLGSKNAFDLNLITNNLNRMTIKADGDVLIGNALLPSSKINVFSAFLGFNSANAIGSSHIVFKDPNTTGYGGMYIDMAGRSGRKPFYGYALSGSAKMFTYYDEATSQWRVNNGGDKLVITNTGNTGIGTITPLVKLHLAGGTDASLGGGIMARNNGAASTLFLNNDGGLVHTGGNLNVGGDISFGSGENFSDFGFGFSAVNTNFSILPDATNTFSLGISSQRWQEAWLSGGVITGSDARIKKNIRDLNYGLKEIMQLRSVKYNLKEGADQNDKLGVIAQEIQKVIPEVVVDYDIVTDKKTGQTTKVPSVILGVRYTDLIPVLIRAIQEQQKEIEELKTIVLVNNQNNFSPTANIKITDALLAQNVPNPFTNTTTISYTLPQKFTTAQIIITDKNGKQLKQLNISGSGKGAVNKLYFTKKKYLP